MAKSKKATKKRAKRQAGPRNSATARTVSWVTVGGAQCLNQTDAARWFGVSVSMFRRYEIEPTAKRGREVYYSDDALKDLLQRQAYQRGFQEGHAAKPRDAADVIEAQAMADLKLTEERAETQALKNAQLRRELAPTEALSMALGRLAGEVAGVLDGLPGRVKRRVPKLTRSEIEAVQRECVKAMNACSDIELEIADVDPGD